MNRQTNIVLTLLVGALLLVQLVAANPGAPTNLEEGPSTRRDLSALPTQTVDAQAGNVTQVNITAIAITNGWQGYYGNVTGTIVLQDGNNQTFYNWSVATMTGEVYATRAAAITWSGVACTADGNISTEETALGMSASDADSVSNTFSNMSSHPQFYVGNVDISADSCWATNAFDDTGAQTTKFFQVLLSDAAGTGNIIYTTLMNGTQTGFNGQGWDFQLLVGEDGHGNDAITQYYFWVELN